MPILGQTLPERSWVSFFHLATAVIGRFNRKCILHVTNVTYYTAASNFPVDSAVGNYNELVQVSKGHAALHLSTVDFFTAQIDL